MLLVSSVNKSSGINQERNGHKSNIIYKPKQFQKIVSGFWCEMMTRAGLFLWRKHYYRSWIHIWDRSDRLKLNCLIDGVVSFKTQFFASQDDNWCTGVVWIIVMFYHSDGTHSLQSIFLGNYSYHGRCFEGCVTWVCTFCKRDYDIWYICLLITVFLFTPGHNICREDFELNFCVTMHSC